MIQSYVLLGALGVHSIEDIKDQKITISFTLFFGIVGILLHLIFRQESIYSMLLGMGSGAVILLLSYLTGGKIGCGDGILFMLTGLYLGMEKNLLLMMISFILAGIWGLLLVTLWHRKKDERIPFVPFLLVSYIGMCIL